MQSSKIRLKYSMHKAENWDYNGDGRFKENRYKGDAKRLFRKRLRLKMKSMGGNEYE